MVWSEREPEREPEPECDTRCFVALVEVERDIDRPQYAFAQSSASLEGRVLCICIRCMVRCMFACFVSKDAVIEHRLSESAAPPPYHHSVITIVYMRTPKTATTLAVIGRIVCGLVIGPCSCTGPVCRTSTTDCCTCTRALAGVIRCWTLLRRRPAAVMLGLGS